MQAEEQEAKHAIFQLSDGHLLAHQSNLTTERRERSRSRGKGRGQSRGRGQIRGQSRGQGQIRGRSRGGRVKRLE